MSVYKGVSGEASIEKDEQDEGRSTKPNSFTWTGKRKSDPIGTSKPFGMSGSKGGSGITIKLNVSYKIPLINFELIFNNNYSPRVLYEI